MYNELAAKLPTEVWGNSGLRRLTVPRCKPAGGSECEVHPRFCPPAVPSGKVLKRLRHGKALVPSVKFCKQELYGRLGRVEVRRLLGWSRAALHQWLIKGKGEWDQLILLHHSQDSQPEQTTPLSWHVL